MCTEPVFQIINISPNNGAAERGAGPISLLPKVWPSIPRPFPVLGAAVLGWMGMQRAWPPGLIWRLSPGIPYKPFPVNQTTFLLRPLYLMKVAALFISLRLTCLPTPAPAPAQQQYNFCTRRRGLPCADFLQVAPTTSLSPRVTPPWRGGQCPAPYNTQYFPIPIQLCRWPPQPPTDGNPLLVVVSAPPGCPLPCLPVSRAAAARK